MQAFGDGFDLYTTVADAVAGYWDSGQTSSFSLVAGRFSGSQAVQFSLGNVSPILTKSSGANDALHHIVCAYRQTATLSGTTIGTYFQLVDGTTNQVCIVFRSDGTILLTSSSPTGTVLDTYTGAVTAANTWFAFEFEVFISSTAGYFNVRKNGNTSNDHTSATNLNTRTSANNYANKLQIGQNAALSNTQFDDLLWRSDPTSVPWVGDIRCYTRTPASDVQAQFSRSPSLSGQTVPAGGGSTATTLTLGVARYSSFAALYDGTIGTVTLSLLSAYSGNIKCSIFASSGSAPTTVLGSATPLSALVSGSNIFTFSTPVPVSKGVQYWIGICGDTTVANCTNNTASATMLQSTTAYASFPVASPGTSSTTGVVTTANITVGTNNSLVNEAQQDGATSYVYDSNVGDADFYAIAALSGTPASTVAVTTRGFLEKSDAGSRAASVQLKSGGTTVASTSTFLSTSWGWLYRTDLTDPGTGSAWTATGVNNVNIGPTVTA